MPEGRAHAPEGRAHTPEGRANVPEGRSHGDERTRRVEGRAQHEEATSRSPTRQHAARDEHAARRQGAPQRASTSSYRAERATSSRRLPPVPRWCRDGAILRLHEALVHLSILANDDIDIGNVRVVVDRGQRPSRLIEQVLDAD